MEMGNEEEGEVRGLLRILHGLAMESRLIKLVDERWESGRRDR